jgi:hypothetical protein
MQSELPVAVSVASEVALFGARVAAALRDPELVWRDPSAVQIWVISAQADYA